MQEINVCGNVWGNGSIFPDYSKPNALTLLIIPAVVKEDIQMIFKSRQIVSNFAFFSEGIYTFAALDNLRIPSISVV